MRSLFLFFVSMLSLHTLFAQSGNLPTQSIFEALPASQAGSLSSDQQSAYSKIASYPDVVALNLVKIKALSQVEANGIILLDLPFLSSESLYFQMKNVNYDSDWNYDWNGELIDDDENDTIPKDGFLTFVNKTSDNGVYAGALGILDLGETKASIHYLGDGLYAIATYGSNNAQLCGTVDMALDESVVIPLRELDCRNRNVKILVLFTQQVVNNHFSGDINTAMWLHAYLNIFKLNSIMDLSGVGRPPVEFDYALLPGFTESSTTADLNALASNGTVSSLRNTTNSDLVVLMTKPYTGILGQARSIGCYNPTYTAIDPNYGFAVVDLAGNFQRGGLVFPHEVGHLFDGRHENDLSTPNNPGYANAYVFTRSFLGLFKKCYPTVLASGYACGDKNRVPLFSTPGRLYNGNPVGTGTNNNARRIREFYYTVGSFYTFNNNFGNSISVSWQTIPPIGDLQPFCDKKAKLEVDYWCGSGGYTHYWEYSINGITWFFLGTGTTQELSTPGTFLVRVTTSSGSLTPVVAQTSITIPCKSAYLDPVSYKIDLKLETAFGITPNPNQGAFVLNYGIETTAPAKIILLDINGRVVEELFNGVLDKAGNKIDIRIRNNIANGLYLVKLSTGNINKTFKLLVQK